MKPRTEVILYLLAAYSTVALLFGTVFEGLEFLIVPIVILTIVVARGLGRLDKEFRWVIPSLVAVGAALAVFSVITGVLNGLTDEPYGTPAYASLGWNLYNSPIAVHYNQYGSPGFDNSYYVYLPLLTFIQIPGVDYRWVCLIAWAAMLYLLRSRPIALAGLTVPWIPLLAANGMNDFVPLFALTLALAVPLGRYQILAEVFALALKQLANVVIVLYHLARREYFRAALAVVITIAILAPFLYIDPSGVYCHVLLTDPGSDCTSRPLSVVIFIRNY